MPMNSTNNRGYLNWVGSISTLVILLFLVGTLNCNAGGSGMNSNDKSQPKIEDYATIESITNGVPVYSFSNIMYVYGQSPDLYPGLVMQEGNTNPAVKFTPKKSWEIKHGYNGATHEMVRRSPANDSQPLLPIHLIDGDPETVWCSWGSAVADERPEWIRIDLPMETEIVSVSLVCAKEFPWTKKNLYNNINYGKALPREVEIQVSKDAWHWETVYENKNVDVDNTTTQKAEFEPVRAKQIWIKANNLTKRVCMQDTYVFSIGEVEVRDKAGNNVALVSRGAGVTVSSTSYVYLNNRYTQDALWNPLQYDLGNKWVRVGLDTAGSLGWFSVEHEKGKLEIDPVVDESITECAKNGVNVIMVLDFKGNWLYSNTPRKANWKEARFREFNDFYTDYLPSVVENQEMFEGYLRYAELMVEHFKDRVAYFEIGNEWDGGFYPDLVTSAPASEWYMTRFFEPTYRVIKKAAPNAKIILGSPCGFPKTRILQCLGKEREYGIVDGKLAGSYQSRLVRDGVALKDGTVSADALNIGAVYMLLRYQDEKNYLKASYNSARKTVSFTEYADGTAIPGAALNEVSVPGGEVHLTAKVQDSKVTFTVSDGKESISLDHTVSSNVLLKEGAVGLGQEQFDWMWTATDAGQRFDNFQVSDLKGKTIAKDTFKGQDGTVPDGWKYIFIDKNPVKKGWGAKVDGIGWHPTNNPDAAYFNSVREFKKECEALGFNGKYFATEIYAGSGYPPGGIDSFWYRSEEGMAKYLTQSVVLHGALDMGAGPCHPHFTPYPHPVSLARWTFPSQIITPCQPSVSYYMWRNVSTVMDDFYPAEFPVKVTSEKEIIAVTFKRGESETMVAAWLNGSQENVGLVESKADITLPKTKAKKAWIVDIANGTEQELNFSIQGGDMVIKGMMIKDYPVFIRMVQD